MSGHHAEKTEHAERKQEKTDVRDGDLAREALSDMMSKRMAAPHGDAPTKPHREVKEDGREVYTNAEGQITQVKDQKTGNQYEYSYDKKGNLSAARIADKDGDADYWVKGKDGKWQSYDEYYGPGDKRNKPGNLELKGGEWQVNEEGRMYHSSGQVVPRPEHSKR